MPGENILVIAIDGLRAAALGAYGNTAFATPGLDQLAAGSFLFDSTYANAVELPQIYRALWQSQHSFDKAGVDSRTLPQLLADRDYTTTLVTDEPAIAALPIATEFGDIVQLTVAVPERADDILQTALARVITAACDELDASDSKRLVWLHAAGMYGPWDAPLELQESLLEREEGDPPPADELVPPDIALEATHDPDVAFRWSCAYAAQVITLDACIAALHDALAELGSDRWLVVLVGVRGFPLGEHGRIGGVDGRLCVDQLHVPLLWRLPNGVGRLARSGELTSHLDVLPTLLDWIDRGGSIPQTATAIFSGVSLLPQIESCDPLNRQDLVAIASSGARAIRTAEWTLRTREIAGDSSESAQLFVRPDDRWEVNDVAALCPDVVQELAARLAAASASVGGAGMPQ